MRCTYGHRTGSARESPMFSYPTGLVRGPCGTLMRHPYQLVRELTQPELAKIPHSRRIWPCGARTGHLRSPHRLFTGCLGYVNPYGARKLIMHALRLYGTHTGGKIRTAPLGARVGPVSGRAIFVENSPGTAHTGGRECDVTGALMKQFGCQLPIVSKS